MHTIILFESMIYIELSLPSQGFFYVPLILFECAYQDSHTRARHEYYDIFKFNFSFNS